MSEGRADLHCHTTASDGTYAPGALVAEAARRGLSAIAVTDHDSVDGVGDAVDAGAFMGVDVVPGVEISTDVGDSEVHILGYFIDCDDEQLLGFLESQRESRVRRTEKMLGKLAALGLPLTIDQVMEFAKDGTVGRPHVAAAMIKAGYVTSWDDAFSRYIGKHAPAYVERSKLTPYEAVGRIRAAGGAAVYAHPGLANRDDMIPSLVEGGLAGIEAIYPDHTSAQTRHYLDVARAYGLLATAGSDCHGPGSKSGVVLGTVTVGYDVVRELEERAAGRR